MLPWALHFSRIRCVVHEPETRHFMSRSLQTGRGWWWHAHVGMLVNMCFRMSCVWPFALCHFGIVVFFYRGVLFCGRFCDEELGDRMPGLKSPWWTLEDSLVEFALNIL